MAGSRRDERAWIRGAQDGSVADLEALFRHHWPGAYRAAYLVVHDAAAAEDIAQESFLAAVRNLGRFDRKRPFGPWLHRIVVNRAIDWSRARALRREIGDAPLGVAAAPAPPDAAHAHALAEALAELSPEHRAVIVLRHLLDYTPGEIAELLDLPRGTVNSRLRRGLDTLAARLAEADLR
ncbi:MAG TPA: RNA polymerase sigma factor [Solirubrobacteraceae bacterium]|jgi:RNA polymerase sigma-70 factor (ECF subfamily)